jgi:hypothetical protein
LVLAQTVPTVNIVDFGADPTGLTYSDDALERALIAAFSDPDPGTNSAVYFPAGRYVFVRPGALNHWQSQSPYRRRVLFRGDGPGTSRIIFRPRTPNSYFYDGLSFPDRRLMLATFKDLGFYVDTGINSGPTHLFRIFGGTDRYPDQGFIFSNIEFQGAEGNEGIILDIEGTINGSENKFEMCSARLWRTAIRSSNPQAVNHYFIGCDFELMTGPIFDFVSGGQLTVVGGSFILGIPGRDGDSSLLRIRSTRSGMTGTFNFSGIRTEVYDKNAVIYDLGGPNLSAVVNINGATHRVLNAGDAVLARVNAFSGVRLLVRGSDLVPNRGRLKIQFVNSQGIGNWTGFSRGRGSVEITDSIIHPLMHQDVSWSSDAVGGLFRTRNCSFAGRVAVGEAVLAADWDLLGPTQGTSVGAVGREPKIVSIRKGFWSGPLGAAVQLPAYSLVTKISLRRQGNAVAEGRIIVANSDRTHIYGLADYDPSSRIHSLEIRNIGFPKLDANGLAVLKVFLVDGAGEGDLKFGESDVLEITYE